MTTELWIVDGAHVRSTVSGLEVSRPAQALVELVIVADPVPPVTLATLEPLVVHPAACKATVVDSELPPFVVSGGEKVSDPVMVVQVTPPEATVTVVVGGPALGLELDPHAVASAATRQRKRRRADLDGRMVGQR